VYVRNYGSKVLHDQRFRATDGTVIVECGRTLGDPAPSTPTIPEGKRHCQDCARLNRH
jgi:hypothetical protein